MAAIVFGIAALLYGHWLAGRPLTALIFHVTPSTILSKEAWYGVGVMTFIAIGLVVCIVAVILRKSVRLKGQTSRLMTAAKVITRIALIVMIADIVLMLVLYFMAHSKSTLSWTTVQEQFPTVLNTLNIGFLQTLKLFAVTLLGAIPLGLIIAFGSMAKNRLLSKTVRVLVWIIRGTPLMLQLLIIFYFPSLVFGKQLWGSGETGRFIASAVAFIINYACYFSEIYRGGIQGVPHGQQEAGQVLGLSKTQIFFRITLLQMIKRIVPPMSNEIITLVKDTSLARIIALQEVIWAGQKFLKGSHGISGAIWPMFFTGVYYLVFSGLLTLLFGWIEKKLSYFKA